MGYSAFSVTVRLVAFGRPIYITNCTFLKVNTLTQLENLKRYKFIKELLDQNKIHAYALWFDIYCGDVYCFSFREKRFIKLDDESYERLISNLYDRLGISFTPTN
jgi:hypothetical protein